MFFGRRRRLNRELDEEIRAHLAIEKQERMDRGETAEQAEQNARRTLGNELMIKEVTREMWGWTAVERVWRDTVYALRQLKRSPGFAAVAILSLALGIGANAAIFSILNALLFKSLPVAAPGELFAVEQLSRATVPQRFSYPMFQRLRDSGSGARGVAAVSQVMRAQAETDAGRQPNITPVQLVSGEFFPLLGVPPALGRLLGPGDNQVLGGHPLAVLSYRYWQRAFAGSSDVVGRTIRLNGAAFTIVGVAPEGFQGLWIESPADVWIPLMMQANLHYAQHFSLSMNADSEKPWPPQEFVEWLDVIVRARPGLRSVISAQLTATYRRAMDTLSAKFPPVARNYFLERSLSLDPLSHGFSNARGRFRSPLIAMMMLVTLVLLIACANAANLLMARAESRRREIAVRLSIGASRGRLIQQLLTESFLLVAVAAGLGLLLARWASEQLVRMALGVANSVPTPFSTAADGRVIAFTAGMAVFTGLLFGLAPAFRATRIELAAAAKQSRAGRFQFGGAKLLVAAQVALSLIVVFGAALFARSLRNLANVNLGFDREHVLTAWIHPRAAGYAPAKLPALYRELVERVESIPGVRSATFSLCGLDVDCRSSDGEVRISGYQPAPGEETRIQYNMTGPGYFSTVGMRLLSGRDLRAGDSGRQFAVINEAMVRRYFAGRNPIGQHFGNDYKTEIVGVIRDARVNRVREEPFPMAYYPLNGNIVYAETLDVRAAGDPNSIAAAVRKAVSEVAPDLPVERITPLALQVERSLSPERMGSVVTAAFGILALGLACFGLYGVMSYAVSRRTSEIGVRMALGAQPRNVLWEVLREALALIAMGLAAGLPVVFFASRAVASLLYEVQPHDPGTLIATAAILTGVAVFAAAWPAWRASRVSPLAALRYE
jgi:predicted permease